MPRHFVFLLGRKLLDKGMKMHDAVAVSDQSFSILLCAQDLLQKAKEEIRRPSEVNFRGLVLLVFVGCKGKIRKHCHIQPTSTARKQETSCQESMVCESVWVCHRFAQKCTFLCSCQSFEGNNQRRSAGSHKRSL